jgi:2-phosphoglycerate kinase
VTAPTARSWHVLLIGGPSGVGKSELVAQLRRRHDIGTVELDDIVSAVRVMSDPATHPALHHAAAGAAEPPDKVVRGLLEAARALQPAVAAVVATHLDLGPPVIVEGDYLLPSIMAAFPDRERVRAVFLWDEESQILANFAHREPKCPAQRERARVSFLFGQKLRVLADRQGVPAVRAQPWASVTARVEASCLEVAPRSPVRRDGV